MCRGVQIKLDYSKGSSLFAVVLCQRVKSNYASMQLVFLGSKLINITENKRGELHACVIGDELLGTCDTFFCLGKNGCMGLVMVN
jgi:hypothetical protein